MADKLDELLHRLTCTDDIDDEHMLKRQIKEYISQLQQAARKEGFLAARATYTVADSPESDADMVTLHEWPTFERYEASLGKSK